MPIVLAILWAVFAGGLTGYIIHMALEIRRPAPVDGRHLHHHLPPLLRLLMPLAPPFTGFFQKPYFKPARERLAQQLTSGGLDDVVAPEEFLALRVLAPLVIGPVLAVLIISLLVMGAGLPAGPRLPALVLAIFLWMLFYPRFWLNQVIALRHKLIVRALPFVMDLLTLSVEAGLDFMAAIKHIVDRRAPDPLGEELSRVIVEIQLGKTRRDALKHMAARVRHPDMLSLVTALVQADELGVSIGAILRIQAEQLRTKRFLRAEKLANEAPVKMLFPLMTCIFPAVFLILLGPIILQMLRQGF